MKKITRSYRWIVMIGLLFVLLAGLVYDMYQTPAAAQRRTTFDFERYTQNPAPTKRDGILAAKPFRLNTLPTTRYGPPWADILTESKSNMLECKGNTAPIALCYYSGPGPTAPCIMDGLGIANCTCYEIPAGQTYYVDINAILNLDVYLKTVAVYGKDGPNCLPSGTRQAPVCDSINNNLLIPGADLISTFSTYLKDKMPMGSALCPSANYAGCMTAPCKRTGKIDPTTHLPLVQCGCPVYDGPYQVGQEISKTDCSLGGNYVWSAAYTAPPRP